LKRLDGRSFDSSGTIHNLAFGFEKLNGSALIAL